MANLSKLTTEAPLTRKPRAVIVGASSGIGAALARRLAAEGYLVAALARSKSELETVCAQINAATPGETRALAYEHDVTAFDLIPAMFQQLMKDLGGIDVLVYCAGVMPRPEPDEFSFEKDKLMMDTNLLGAVAWLGQGVTLFQRMGGGKLVGISSVSGDRGRVLNPAYNASKAGMDTYLEALRNRLTRHGVHVLTVKPGFVETDMLKNSPTSHPGKITPDECAAGIWKAMRGRKQLVYIPWYWRWIMLIVKLIPSFIFRRLSF
jgi:short-subunit dehydrogenase